MCEKNQKFWLAMSIMSILLVSLLLDAFGFKPSDIIIGGIIGAIGSMTQDYFSKKTPDTDAAVARKIDAIPPPSPEPIEAQPKPDPDEELFK